MTFRKFLVDIRKNFNTNKRNLFIYSITTLILSVALGFIVDVFTDFNGIWMIIRSLILILQGISLFVVAYSVSLFLHYSKMKDVENEWTPYRARYSPAWRLRISLLIGAFIFVAQYANEFNAFYTFRSSVTAAVVIAIFAFLRKTSQEKRNEELEIPDIRDVKYEASQINKKMKGNHND